MTSNLDTSACRVAQPCGDRPQEALSFVAAPSVVNHSTLTELTTDENSHVALIDHAWTGITKNRDSKEVIQI